MKIAMVTWHYPPNIYGGGEISCKLLVDALKKEKHDVDVFVLDDVFPSIKSKISLNICTYSYLKDKLDTYEYDIVHCYNMALLPSIGELTKKKGVTSYATLNGIVFSPSLSVYSHKVFSPKYYRNRFFFNKIKDISSFSTLCEYWRKKWIEDGIPSEKISVITNMIDPDFPVTKRKKHSGFNILHVGNYSPTRAKEIEDTIKIFSALKTDDVVLTMIGKGAREKKNLEKKYKPKNEIKILEEVGNSNLSKYYAEADFFLHPSILPKGNDRVIIEAMQHGCVVLTHCSDELSPIIEDNKSGFLIYPNMNSVYVKRIKLLMKDKKMISNISKNAKKQVKEVCSPNKITKEYLEKYRYIINVKEVRN